MNDIAPNVSKRAMSGPGIAVWLRSFGKLLIRFTGISFVIWWSGCAWSRLQFCCAWWPSVCKDKPDAQHSRKGVLRGPVLARILCCAMPARKAGNKRLLQVRSFPMHRMWLLACCPVGRCLLAWWCAAPVAVPAASVSWVPPTLPSFLLLCFSSRSCVLDAQIWPLLPLCGSLAWWWQRGLSQHRSPARSICPDRRPFCRRFCLTARLTPRPLVPLVPGPTLLKLLVPKPAPSSAAPALFGAAWSGKVFKASAVAQWDGKSKCVFACYSVQRSWTGLVLAEMLMADPLPSLLSPLGSTLLMSLRAQKSSCTVSRVRSKFLPLSRLLVPTLLCLRRCLHPLTITLLPRTLDLSPSPFESLKNLPSKKISRSCERPSHSPFSVAWAQSGRCLPY